MTAIQKGGIIITKETKKMYDYSTIFDISKFVQPAECFISEEDEYCTDDLFLEFKYQKYVKIIGKGKLNRAIGENHTDLQSNIMDIFSIIPAEILIEDEIKKGYFW